MKNPFSNFSNNLGLKLLALVLALVIFYSVRSSLLHRSGMMSSSLTTPSYERPIPNVNPTR